VPTSTVRYYERIGLLHANGRTGGNYRFYSAPCQEVQSLIEERLSDTVQRLIDLQHVQRVLKSSLKSCWEVEDSDHCQVIDDLTGISSVSA